MYHSNDCDCGCKPNTETIHLSLGEELFKKLLNIGEKAFKHLHKKGSYKPEDLATEKPYQNLISETNAIFKKAVTDNVIEGAMLESLKNDIYLFSGLKTHAQLAESSRLLLDESGKMKSFQAFSRDFSKINETYNQNYLRVEHDYAVGTAQTIARWETFSDNEENFNLQYRTDGGPHVRQSHEALNRTTLPKSDPFWDSYTPKNGWNCHCMVVQVLADKYPKSDSEKAIAKGEKATTQLDKNEKNKLEIFRFNPAKEKVIFPPSHPYSKVAGAKKIIKDFKTEKIEYKEYSIDKLKEVYKTQKIDKSKESIIMNDGYVASGNSFSINEKIREGKQLSEKDKKVVDSLDSLIKSNKIKDNVNLYRNDGLGFIESHFNINIKGLDNGDAIKKLKATNVSEITNKGYFSTSTVKTANEFTWRKIHSEIRTKEGTNAFAPDNFNESEIILGRNQKFNIVDIVEDNGKIKIIMETI